MSKKKQPGRLARAMGSGAGMIASSSLGLSFFVWAWVSAILADIPTLTALFVITMGGLGGSTLLLTVAMYAAAKERDHERAEAAK